MRGDANTRIPQVTPGAYPTNEAETLRRQISSLESEVRSSREKRDGLNRAIAERLTKLSRLQAQLAMCEPTAILLPSACG